MYITPQPQRDSERGKRAKEKKRSEERIRRQ
jgi:hypothetical protein